MKETLYIELQISGEIHQHDLETVLKDSLIKSGVIPPVVEEGAKVGADTVAAPVVAPEDVAMTEKEKKIEGAEADEGSPDLPVKVNHFFQDAIDNFVYVTGETGVSIEKIGDVEEPYVVKILFNGELIGYAIADEDVIDSGNIEGIGVLSLEQSGNLGEATEGGMFTEDLCALIASHAPLKVDGASAEKVPANKDLKASALEALGRATLPAGVQFVLMDGVTYSDEYLKNISEMHHWVNLEEAFNGLRNEQKAPFLESKLPIAISEEGSLWNTCGYVEKNGKEYVAINHDGGIGGIRSDLGAGADEYLSKHASEEPSAEPSTPPKVDTSGDDDGADSADGAETMSQFKLSEFEGKSGMALHDLVNEKLGELGKKFGIKFGLWSNLDPYSDGYLRDDVVTNLVNGNLERALKLLDSATLEVLKSEEIHIIVGSEYGRFGADQEGFSHSTAGAPRVTIDCDEDPSEIAKTIKESVTPVKEEVDVKKRVESKLEKLGKEFGIDLGLFDNEYSAKYLKNDVEANLDNGNLKKALEEIYRITLLNLANAGVKVMVSREGLLWERDGAGKFDTGGSCIIIDCDENPYEIAMDIENAAYELSDEDEVIGKKFVEQKPLIDKYYEAMSELNMDTDIPVLMRQDVVYPNGYIEEVTASLNHVKLAIGLLQYESRALSADEKHGIKDYYDFLNNFTDLGGGRINILPSLKRADGRMIYDVELVELGGLIIFVDFRKDLVSIATDIKRAIDKYREEHGPRTDNAVKGLASPLVKAPDAEVVPARVQKNCLR